MTRLKEFGRLPRDVAGWVSKLLDMGNSISVGPFLVVIFTHPPRSD